MIDHTTTHTSLGELIVALYEQYLEIYADEDLASVAAAATLNELISETVDLNPEAAAA